MDSRTGGARCERRALGDAGLAARSNAVKAAAVVGGVVKAAEYSLAADPGVPFAQVAGGVASVSEVAAPEVQPA
jgi:hypothetical protein